MAVGCYRLSLEDGPDMSDSSDDGNKPDELGNMYAPGCLEGDSQLGGIDAFHFMNGKSRRPLSSRGGSR
jgi:hypothetical protein